MRVDAVRSFNRFYTRRIGALRADFVGSPYPLPEARLLYELGRRRRCTATELRAELDLDAGYLSRMLGALGRRGLVRAGRSSEDARARVLSLTARGREAFALLDRRSRDESSIAAITSCTRTPSMKDGSHARFWWMASMNSKF